jgi:predicted GNAT family N-acyltransferase
VKNKPVYNSYHETMKNFIIKPPETESDFEQYFQLRWKILRKPWHQKKGTEQDNDEKTSYHLMAIENNTVLGVARLQLITQNKAQLRYMAVENTHSGLGIGKAIVQSMENYALNNNIHSIMLHARENAVGFYEKLGYKIIEKSYLLFDSIQHYEMKKEL